MRVKMLADDQIKKIFSAGFAPTISGVHKYEDKSKDAKPEEVLEKIGRSVGNTGSNWSTM